MPAVPARSPDHAPHTPLYGRIAALMRQRIRGGVWPAHGQIPTIEALMAEFGASRVTVRQALELLEREGLIDRQRGRGTFVTEQGGAFEWIELGQSWRALVDAIGGTRPRLIGVEDGVQPPGAAGMGATPAPAYRCLKRVHSRGGVPFAVMHLYVDRRCHALAPERFDNEPVIPILQALPGVRIGRARQTLTIASAEPEVAKQLRIPLGAPVGTVRRVISDADGVAIYVGDLVYRGDLIRVELDLDIPETREELT